MTNLGCYNANPNIKRAYQNVDWTPELITEYTRCAEDPIYFIESYMKIINVDDGLINFKLYPYQKDMIRSFMEERNSVVTSARQSGKSVTCCGFILWYIIFNDDKTVALLANKGDTAREILSRVTFGYSHLPKWLQQGVIEMNKGSLSLENNSRVFATATSSSGIRGYTVNLLFIDEAAFVENWEEFFTSVYPTISAGIETKVILVSTPYGLNHFHKIWVNAIHGRNGYRPIQVMWTQVPGRGEKWRQDTLAAMNFDQEKFNQEMCCEFLGSSGSLIAGWKLKELVHEEPLTVKEGLYQYALPDKKNRYAMVCDVSRGKGLDYSAFQVIDVTKMPYQQVCVFRDNSTTPGDFSSIIYRTAVSYNNASVLVEINDIGEQVAHNLHHDLGYEHIMFSENAGRSGKKITAGFGGGKNVDMGIRTTKVVKSVGCSLVKLLIEQNQFILNDHETIKEFHTFSKKAQSYEAESGFHDDLVICCVLFAWMTEQEYFKEMTDINTLMALRDKTEQEIEESLLVFGFVDDGRDEEPYWKNVDSDYWTPLPQLEKDIYW